MEAGRIFHGAELLQFEWGQDSRDVANVLLFSE
jgi:hypothetical protein